MGFSYQVSLGDPSNAGGSADAILAYDLQQALAVWSNYISGLGTLTVALDIANTTEGRESGGATSVSFVTTKDGINIYEPSSFYELTTGKHVSGTSSDITITVSPGYFQYLDLSPNLTYNSQVATHKYNPIVVFLHELAHGFGLNGYFGQNGVLTSDSETIFDTEIQQTTGGGAYFVGANAEAAYGGPVPLTTTSSAGENYYHFGNAQSDLFRSPSTVQDLLTLDLMNGIVYFFNYQYAISPLDLGVLKDLGYRLASAAPGVTRVTASPGTGNVSTGTLVTLTVTMSAPVTVSGTPGLMLNDGGIASYDAARSTPAVLIFSYTVQSGESTTALAVTGYSSNGGSIQDASGNGAGLTAARATFSGLGVNTGNNAGLIGNLTTSQQLELIYIGYFNRSADGAEFSVRSAQYVAAQASGQAAGTALTNIANAFASQPETFALYPFLNSTGPLTTPAARSGLSGLVDSVYGNLFGHAADAASKTYWMSQITSGSIVLGAAILAISNGALGGDAISVRNKIAVANDFTTRTTASGLPGKTAASATQLVAAARASLSGVDGNSLNDASVTAGISATTAFIQTATASGSALPMAPEVSELPATGDHLFILGANDRVTTGAGADTIKLLPGAFQSATAADIGWVEDFTAGIDKIVAGNADRQAAGFFDGTGFNVETAADVAAAASLSFADMVALGIAETPRMVLEFKFNGDLFDAISLDGDFHSGNGYTGGFESPVNMIVKVTGLSGMQSAADFRV